MTDNENFKYFVWVQGLRGPEPQIWDREDQTREGKPIATIGEPVQLISGEESLELGALSLRYPHG